MPLVRKGRIDSLPNKKGTSVGAIESHTVSATPAMPGESSHAGQITHRQRERFWMRISSLRTKHGTYIAEFWESD
jgi:hypothetical protein